jgi:penicillin-binding protein activator
MRHIRSGVLLSLALTVSLAACGGPAIARLAPEQAIDLSGRWNDVDSRVVAEALIKQTFESPYGPNWAMRHAQSNGGRAPTVIVGSIRNRSMEHIQVGTFVRDIERAFVNSGLVQVVASREERAELRDERADQQDNAAANTRSRVGQETGANYMLQGEIQTIEDREGPRSVMFYQIDVTVVDLQSNVRTWVGQHKIKKYIERSRLRV